MFIDYSKINDSIDFYSKVGYKRIETPWLVSREIHDITRPENKALYTVTKNEKIKTFVASGEQSFLYLINKSQLSSGFYQTTTPCLRNDDFDDLHTKYFIKNELIYFEYKKNIQFNQKNFNHILENMLYDALKFFSQYDSSSKFIFEKSDENVTDIKYKGVEIGSYGIRSSNFCNWVFGTGCAEPRFSTVLNMEYK